MSESNTEDHGLNDSNHPVETIERGCFNFVAKKEAKPKHDVVMEEPMKENKDDLRRLHSQSSSLSDEEYEGERKKNKNTLEDNTNKDDEEHDIKVVDVDEKKGFLENIKAHLPGKHSKTEENAPTPEPTCESDCKHVSENETKEKKGILEKIKEKLHKSDEKEIGENKKDN